MNGPRFCSKETNDGTEYTFRAAWSDYLQRVPPVSFRQTRNCMMAVIAEGRSFDRDDTMLDAKTRGCPIVCPCSIDEIGNFVNIQRTSNNAPGQNSADKDTSNGTVSKFMASMEASMSVARRLVQSQ